MTMKYFIMFTYLISAASFASPLKPASTVPKEAPVVISTDVKVADFLKKRLNLKEFASHKKLSDSSVSLLTVYPSQLDQVSSLIHREFHRCGGFMVESGESTLKELVNVQPERDYSLDKNLYEINQQETVRAIAGKVSEENLIGTIKKLSAYPNRYYRSANGQSSQQWVKQQWEQLAARNANITVDLVSHSEFPQPSVRLTWKGKSSKASEVVVLGGHGDSIAGFMPRNDSLAPGADDNASGIATITEVIRLLIDQGFQPDRTVHIFSYAAEEVGLRGSADIARQYKNSQVPVVGVMQLDMVNFSDNRHDIVMITDHTDNEQNTFVKNLLASYLPQLRVGENPCGYACSDHASWTRQGYPASFPFEAAMEDYNSAIHTSRDTLDRSANRARHAVPFVTLAAAYVVELATI